MSEETVENAAGLSGCGEQRSCGEGLQIGPGTHVGLDMQVKLTEQSNQIKLTIGDQRFVYGKKWLGKMRGHVPRSTRAEKMKKILSDQRPTKFQPRKNINEDMFFRQYFLQGFDYSMMCKELQLALLERNKLLGEEQKPLMASVQRSGVSTGFTNFNVQSERLSVTLIMNFQMVTRVVVQFTMQDTYSKLHDIMRNVYKVGETTLSRLWISVGNGPFDPVELKHGDDIPDCDDKTLIVLETIGPSGLWLRPFEQFLSVCIENIFPGLNQFIDDPEFPDYIEELFTIINDSQRFCRVGLDAPTMKITELAHGDLIPGQGSALLNDFNDEMTITIVDKGAGATAPGGNTLPNVSITLGERTVQSLTQAMEGLPSTYVHHVNPLGNENMVSSTSENDKLPYGIGGLDNNGQVCFRNAALQCVSNVFPLTELLLSMNTTKVKLIAEATGRGYMVVAYADLLRLLWTDNKGDLSTNEIQRVLDMKNIRFSSIVQHDASEWLLSFLMALHSDLNIGNTKLKIPELVDDPTLSDQQLADNAWKCHTIKDESIVTDLFYAMFRSSLKCPVCGKKSTKMDPFSYVVLPVNITIALKIVVFRLNVTLSTTHEVHQLELLQVSSTKDLLVKIGTLCGVDPQNLILVTVVKHRLEKVFKLNDQISRIRSDAEICVFETPSDLKNGTDYVIISVSMWSNSTGIFSPLYLFSYPLVLFVPVANFTNAYLQNAIFKKLVAFLNLPPESASWLNECSMKDPFNPSLDEEKSHSPKNTFQLCTLSNLKEKVTEPKIVPYDGNMFPLSGLELSVSEGQLAIYITKENRDRMWRNCYKYVGKKGVNKMPVTLKQCFDSYVSDEVLDSLWKCPSCQNDVYRVKRVEFWSLPQYLVVTLNRFASTGPAQGHVKDCRSVEVPLDLDLTEYLVGTSGAGRYVLNSVCLHTGTITNGHYTAQVRSLANGDWYFINDTFCKVVRDTTTIAPPQDVYMAVYQLS